MGTGREETLDWKHKLLYKIEGYREPSNVILTTRSMVYKKHL